MREELVGKAIDAEAMPSPPRRRKLKKNQPRFPRSLRQPRRGILEKNPSTFPNKIMLPFNGRHTFCNLSRSPKALIQSIERSSKRGR